MSFISQVDKKNLVITFLVMFILLLVPGFIHFVHRYHTMSHDLEKTQWALYRVKSNTHAAVTTQPTSMVKQDRSALSSSSIHPRPSNHTVQSFTKESTVMTKKTPTAASSVKPSATYQAQKTPQQMAEDSAKIMKQAESIAMDVMNDAEQDWISVPGASSTSTVKARPMNAIKQQPNLPQVLAAKHHAVSIKSEPSTSSSLKVAQTKSTSPSVSKIRPSVKIKASPKVIIQVGSFADLTRAQQWVGRLKHAGFQAESHVDIVHGRGLAKVWVHTLARESTSVKLALKRQFKLKGFVING